MKEIKLYTDGACSGNPGPGGWACVLLYRQYRKEINGFEINATNIPPIAKIMDFGKYKYEQKKKAAEARKKQKTNELKEVWVRPFIEENDMNTKIRKVMEFLGDGDKVKISVMKKGSKLALARARGTEAQLFDRIIALVGDAGVLETKSKPDEKTKSIIIAPAK